MIAWGQPRTARRSASITWSVEAAQEAQTTSVNGRLQRPRAALSMSAPFQPVSH